MKLMRRRLVSLILTALLVLSCCQGAFADECTTHVYPEGTNETIYLWSDDGTTCTAERACNNDNCAYREDAVGTVTQTSSTSATFTEYGTLTYTATFSVDWAVTIMNTIQNSNDPPKKNTHDSSHTTSQFLNYVWAKDYSTCTAEWSCTKCGVVMDTDTAQITTSITTPATCTSDGLCKKTATFTKKWATSLNNVKEGVKVDALGHSLKADGENYKCTRGNCDYTISKADLSQSLKITGADKVCKSSDYTFTFKCPTGHLPSAKYEFKKTGSDAILSNVGEVYTGTIPSKCFTSLTKDESFKLTVYYTLADNTQISAVKYVSVQAEHSYGTATCTDPKKCSLCEHEEEGSALGHDWKATTYDWKKDADEWTCTATRVCKRDSEHVETAKATVTSNTTTPATCTTDGVRTYTATFTEDWAETRTKTETIEKLGHKLETKTDTQTHEYWVKCTRANCNYTSERKSIPNIEIVGSDKVCNGEDYTFKFTPPKGYEKAKTYFVWLLDSPDWREEIELEEGENGTYIGTVKAEDYNNDTIKNNIEKLGLSDITYFKVIGLLVVDESLPLAFGGTKTINIVDHDYSVPATCKSGITCSNCGKEQENGAVEPNNHSNLQYFPAKEATTKEEGSLGYWYCDGCGKYYTSEEAVEDSEVEREEVIISKLPEKEKAKEEKNKSNSPATSDDSNVMGWGTLMAVGAIYAVIAGKKRRRA